MRLNHADYNKLLIAAYHHKRLNNELSPLLAQSTPAGIRKECATVYEERFDKKDEPMLRAFFGPGEQGRKFLALIREFEVDRFRPLDGFLKEEGRKGITDRNLALLAWLIDFKHRPFVFGMEVFLSEKEHQLLTMGNDTDDPEKEAPGVSPEQDVNDTGESTIPEVTGVDNVNGHSGNEELKDSIGKNEKVNKPGTLMPVGGWRKNMVVGAVVVFLSLLASYGGIYIYNRHVKTTEIPFGTSNAACMYWANDHYERVSCREAPDGRLFLPLDQERLKHFRKVTLEDTITEKSIGVLYYLSTNRKKEYFTAGGKHPVQLTRELKVLSRYIFDNHLRKNTDAVSNSLAKEK